MSNYKYPYIKGGDDMVSAVLGACSWIRKGGYFNKAVRYYSRKYNVNPDELAANIHARQAAGQKGRKSESAGKKYKYFLVREELYDEVSGCDEYPSYEVVRGLSEDTVRRRFRESDEEKNYKYMTGSSYDPIWSHTIIGQYNTKQEAEKALEKYNNGEH